MSPAADMDKRVLVVEDDEPTQKLLVALMQRIKVGAMVAGNGAEAIDLLREKSFDAIILDLMMPTVGGHDVISFVEQQQKPTPIIVCTAAGPRANANVNSSVVKAIFRKPFDIDELGGTVTSVVRS
jgi:DNA-binding response OmpR family regulator